MSIVYRKAVQNDETYILDVLKEVAAEIPISVTSGDNQKIIEGIIIQCRQSEKSWVAVNENGTIVGFALAKSDMHEPNALSLRYIAVSKNSRKQKIFGTLVEKLKVEDVPINTSVLNGNKSKMIENLPKVGFTKKGSDASETKFRWDPPNAAQADKA